MGLATDILKRAFREPVNLVATPRQRTQAQRKPGERKPKKRREPIKYTAPEHEHIVGISFVTTRNSWAAYCGVGANRVKVGNFPTQARAAIAKKIYEHWMALGLTDIPNKPDKRQWTRWDTVRNYPKSITANT